MTIRTRLALWYAIMTALVIISMSLTIFLAMRASMIGTMDAMLDGAVNQVLGDLAVVPVGDFGAPAERIVFLDDSAFRSPGVSIQVWGGAGENPTLLRASSQSMRSPLDETGITATGRQYTSVEVDGISTRVVTLPLVVAGNPFAMLQIGTSMEPLLGASRVLLLIMLGVGALGTILSFFLGLWLANRALAPIDAITEAAGSIARTENLATRLPWTGPDDELGRLTSVFNHMMERLEHLFSVQRRFVADVSHELRTPLTAIHGHVEMMQRYGANPESLDAVCTEAERMTNMVNDLLMLARADYGELKIDMGPTLLATVALEVYERAVMLTRDSSTQVHLGRVADVRVMGNADRLRQLLQNLVSNAIKFTPEGGKITIEVYEAAGQAVIAVQDTGIGMPAEACGRIFDRFYQVDAVRTVSSAEGYGLGLSIVKWIADAHGARIEVESNQGTGTLMRVIMPALKAPSGEHIAGTHARQPVHLVPLPGTPLRLANPLRRRPGDPQPPK
jgi:two-component system, OmpR family, sensor kinase